MTTNIAANHRAAFEVLVSGAYRNFALFSCFIKANRQPRLSPSIRAATAMPSNRFSSALRPRSCRGIITDAFPVDVTSLSGNTR